MSVISFLGNSHITVILIVATGTECLFAVRRKPFRSAAELSPYFRQKHWLLLPPLARPLKRSFSAEFKIGFPHLGWPFPLAPVLYPGSSVILKLHLGILFSSAASLRLTSCVFSLASSSLSPDQNHLSCSPVFINPNQRHSTPSSGEALPLSCPQLSLHPIPWPQIFPIKFLGSIVSELICFCAWVDASLCPRQDACLIRLVCLLCPLKAGRVLSH